MKKSLVIALEDFKANLVKLVNECGISPYFLEPIIKELYFEIHDASTSLVQEEYKTEAKRQEESSKTDSSISVMHSEDIDTMISPDANGEVTI